MNIRWLPGESEVYSWAMRKGVPDPAGFAAEYAPLAGDETALQRMGIRATLRVLYARRTEVREKIGELSDSLRSIDDRINELEGTL